MVAKRQQRAHLASYRVLLVHLLKWQMQSERRSRSWATTISRERSNILERELTSKGFWQMSVVHLEFVYPSARRQAARETGLPLSALPATCPYSLDFLRDHDAMPE